MPYVGQTYFIPCTGSWIANPNFNHVPQEAMVDVNNVNVHNGGRQPRGGSEVKNSTPITDSPKVMGIYQFFREDGVVENGYIIDENGDYIGDENGNMIVFGGADIITVTSDGKIQRNYSTELYSGWTEELYAYFETYYNELFISNGIDTPQTWGEAESYTWDIGTPKKCTSALAGAAGNVDNGNHYYKVTFVTSSGESSGGVASDVLTVTNKAVDGQVDLTAIPTGYEGTTARKIYRTEAGGSDYKLLTTLSDNTTTTYTDNTADSGLGAAIPTDNLAFCPTDWINNYPKYFLKHGRGVNKRLWAWGCEGSPNILYASSSGVPDFGDDSVITIRIMCDRITGAVEFGENLIVFSKDKTFLVNDAALTVANWGYVPALWEGGAAHQNAIVKTPTDVLVMSDDSNLFSIRASQQYGDFQIASLTRPVYLHKWIKANVDIVQINKFHMRFDPDLRAIKIFVVISGEEWPTYCLVYFIDEGLWTKHSFAINYVSSTTVRETTATWKLYTGDDGGTVYGLEWSTLLDDDTAYNSNFTLPPTPYGNPRSNKQYDKIWLEMTPKGTETMHIEATIDQNTLTTDYTITADGADDKLKLFGVPLGAVGEQIQLDISNEDGDDYFITQVLIDSKELGQGA